MNLALKILEAFVPLIIEAIKNHHPEKSADEHLQIAHDLIVKRINKRGE